MTSLAGLTWALLRLRRGWLWKRAIHVALWALLALLAKPIGGPAALLIIVPLLVFVPATRRLPRRLAAVGALVAAIGVCYVAMAVAATWKLFGTGGPLTSARYGISYLWQFYLPPLSFMDTAHFAYHGLPMLPSWRVWVETGTGYFGWLTTPMPSWTYNLAFWALAAAAAVSVVAALTRPDRRTGAALALLIAGLANVLLLHLAEILALIQGSPELILQGRYLIAVVPLFVAALFQPYARIGKAGLVASGGILLVSAVLSLEAMNTVLVFFG
jgi:hypothetical protein